MKDHENANPKPLPKQPAIYFRVKRSGKWVMVPAQRQGFQHEHYVQIGAYVYTDGEE